MNWNRKIICFYFFHIYGIGIPLMRIKLSIMCRIGTVCGRIMKIVRDEKEKEEKKISKKQETIIQSLFIFSFELAALTMNDSLHPLNVFVSFSKCH